MRRLLLTLGVLAALAAPARADSPHVSILGVLTSTNAVIISTTPTASQPMKQYALQVKASTGAATSWSVSLQGSLDGANYTTIITHTDADGDGATKVQSTAWPAQWLRLKTSTITFGGASPQLNVYAVGVQ